MVVCVQSSDRIFVSVETNPTDFKIERVWMVNQAGYLTLDIGPDSFFIGGVGEEANIGKNNYPAQKANVERLRELLTNLEAELEKSEEEYKYNLIENAKILNSLMNTMLSLGG